MSARARPTVNCLSATACSLHRFPVSFTSPGCALPTPAGRACVSDCCRAARLPPLVVPLVPPRGKLRHPPTPLSSCLRRGDLRAVERSAARRVWVSSQHPRERGVLDSRPATTPIVPNPARFGQSTIRDAGIRWEMRPAEVSTVQTGRGRQLHSYRPSPLHILSWQQKVPAPSAVPVPRRRSGTSCVGAEVGRAGRWPQLPATHWRAAACL